MRKIKELFGILIVLTLMASLCGGCGGAGEVTEGPVNTAFVITVANNNPVVDPGQMQELQELPSNENSGYAIILADGAPSLLVSGRIQDYSDRGYSSSMRSRIESQAVQELRSIITEAIPDDPQVDVASAISLGVRALRANAVEGQPNYLVFYGSGISTAGIINMLATPVYRMDIEGSVRSVADSLALEMNGIEVVWYSCGDTTAPQEALSPAERETLRDYYRNLLTAMGAVSVTFRDDLPPGGVNDFAMPVDPMLTEGTVSALRERVVSVDEGYEDVRELIEGESILSFSEDTIAFFPDSTELIDPAAASISLSAVVSYMKDHPGFTLSICGTTASVGDEESCILFSQRRAERVRELLIEAGIDPERIEVLGCGYSSSLYIDDRMMDGSLNEDVAPLNRAVYLLSADSEAHEEILRSLTSVWMEMEE